MKNLIKTILAILLVISYNNLFAQAPDKMSYQAIVRDASNNLLNNTSVGMRVSILQGSTNGNAVFIETHTPSSNTNGLVTIEIGNGTNVNGSFSNIDWANGPFFIKTETDPTGGTSYSLSGISQLLSMPYALYAKNAGYATGGGNFLHHIGEEFGGGVIFHLWKDAQGVEHGLIVDKTHLSTGYVWSNVDNFLVGISAQSSWNGLANSTAIVSQPGHTTSAAALCLNSNNGGYNDWYLPAMDELGLLWRNRFNVNKTLSTIPGATNLPNVDSHWSSTEDSGVGAWNFAFGGGIPSNSLKNLMPYVRAIRAF